MTDEKAKMIIANYVFVESILSERIKFPNKAYFAFNKWDKSCYDYINGLLCKNFTTLDRFIFLSMNQKLGRKVVSKTLGKSVKWLYLKYKPVKDKMTLLMLENPLKED